MEEKDFRRRLLNQELPVDAGDFAHIMERRKAVGKGAGFAGKGIWVAALLIATAGIGIYVQRGLNTPSVADNAAPAEIIQDAYESGNASRRSPADNALYPALSATQGSDVSAVAKAGSSGKEAVEIVKQSKDFAFARPAGNTKDVRTGANNNADFHSANRGAVLQGGLPAGGERNNEIPGESESRDADNAGGQFQYEGWTALVSQSLRMFPDLRKPLVPSEFKMKCSKPIAQRFLQIEWMAEPGWVLKQSEAGPALRRQERFAGAAAFTARAVFPSSRGFQWVSGIRYQEWVDHFNFSEEHTATHQRIDAYDVIIRVPGQPDRTETRYDTSQIQVTRLESYADINRYRTIGIPLAFRWSPTPDGIWYVQAGITPSYLLYRGGSRRLSDGTVVSLSEGANINRFQLHAGLAAGMRRFIAPRIAMMLEPGLGYNLTAFASGPLRQRNLQLSLSAGLMFHLGR